MTDIAQIEANKSILLKLSKYLNEHPNIRFQEALQNLCIIEHNDKFFENSIDTLATMPDFVF